MTVCSVEVSAPLSLRRFSFFFGSLSDLLSLLLILVSSFQTTFLSFRPSFLLFVAFRL